jgi:hypothetical protein
VFKILPSVIEKEKGHFYKSDLKWQPVSLITSPQSRMFLNDLLQRFQLLSSAKDELKLLDRADKYLGLLRGLHFFVRRALFVWKSDHLMFIDSVSRFYGLYGVVLQLLKQDYNRGKFKPHAVN